MPFAGSETILQGAIALAGLVTDTAGLASIGSLSTALLGWFVDNTKVTALDNTPPPDPPVPTWNCAGGSIIGHGNFHFSKDGNDLGDTLAASIPATDAPAIAKWRALGNALCDYLAANAHPPGINILYTPPSSPLTGSSNILNYAAPPPSGFFSTPMALTGPNAPIFDAIGLAILAHMAQHFLMVPGVFAGADGVPPTGFALLT